MALELLGFLIFLYTHTMYLWSLGSYRFPRKQCFFNYLFIKLDTGKVFFAGVKIIQNLDGSKKSPFIPFRFIL